MNNAIVMKLDFDTLERKPVEYNFINKPGNVFLSNGSDLNLELKNGKVVIGVFSNILGLKIKQGKTILKSIIGHLHMSSYYHHS